MTIVGFQVHFTDPATDGRAIGGIFETEMLPHEKAAAIRAQIGGFAG